MALHDLGFVDVEEPFTRLRLHGTITKDGAKMSKSRGNVVNPDDYVDRHGADVLRGHLFASGGGRPPPTSGTRGSPAWSGCSAGCGGWCPARPRDRVSDRMRWRRVRHGWRRASGHAVQHRAAPATATVVQLVVQVDGRVRDRLTVPTGLGEADVIARAEAAPNAIRHLDGRPVRRHVYVPDRLVNLLTTGPDA